MPGDKNEKKKTAEPAAPSVATNPNFTPMQQPAAFAPGMQNMLASQLSAGYGAPAGLLGSSSTQDFNGLLNSIYNPQNAAQAADPIGAALATANKPGQIAAAKAAADPNAQIGSSGQINNRVTTGRNGTHGPGQQR